MGDYFYIGVGDFVVDLKNRTKQLIFSVTTILCHYSIHKNRMKYVESHNIIVI